MTSFHCHASWCYPSLSTLQRESTSQVGREERITWERWRLWYLINLASPTCLTSFRISFYSNMSIWDKFHLYPTLAQHIFYDSVSRLAFLDYGNACNPTEIQVCLFVCYILLYFLFGLLTHVKLISDTFLSLSPCRKQYRMEVDYTFICFLCVLG